MDDRYYRVNLESPLYKLCWRYLQEGAYSEAYDHAANIIRLYPDEAEGYIFKARALFFMGKFEESESALITLLKIADDNVILKNDTTGIIKLRDELGNVRVELLKKLKYTDPYEIAEMYWGNDSIPVKDLIGHIEQSRDVLMEVDRPVSILRRPRMARVMTAPEKSRMLTHQLTTVPRNTQNQSTSLGQSVASVSSINRRLSAKFPVRTQYFDGRVSDAMANHMENARIKKMIDEDNRNELNMKADRLEKELKSVYSNYIIMSKELDSTRKEIALLKKELRTSEKETELWKNRYRTHAVNCKSDIYTNTMNEPMRRDEQQLAFAYERPIREAKYHRKLLRSDFNESLY